MIEDNVSGRAVGTNMVQGIAVCNGSLLSFYCLPTASSWRTVVFDLLTRQFISTCFEWRIYAERQS
jgi:hypothetical protein